MEKKGMIQEFKNFIMRGNVLDMAVGVIIAGAFGKITTSLVNDLLMPFISQQNGYILSPYMDYLSFFFNKDWRYPMRDLASIMIKLADEEKGSIEGKKIDKSMTAADKERMQEAVALSREILARMGFPAERQLLCTLLFACLHPVSSLLNSYLSSRWHAAE